MTKGTTILCACMLATLAMTSLSGCGSDSSTSGTGGSGGAATGGAGGAAGSSSGGSAGDAGVCTLTTCTSSNDCGTQPCMATAGGKNYCFGQGTSPADCAAGSSAATATVKGAQVTLCVPDGCPQPTTYVP